MGPPAAGDEAAIHAHRRAEMLKVVQAHATAGYAPAAISPAVIAAMDRVERHEFVPEALRALAYEDRPLPIGYGQTISTAEQFWYGRYGFRGCLGNVGSTLFLCLKQANCHGRYSKNLRQTENKSHAT